MTVEEIITTARERVLRQIQESIHGCSSKADRIAQRPAKQELSGDGDRISILRVQVAVWEAAAQAVRSAFP